MAVPLEQFAEAARRYCDWCEGVPGRARQEAQMAYDLLVNLLACAPPMRQGYGGGGFGQTISDEAWQKMHARFASLPFQYYHSPLNPLDLDKPDMGMGDLADDLADIWRDLKLGLVLYDDNRHADAREEWQFGYEVHWGRHAAEALGVLHYWLADNRNSP